MTKRRFILPMEKDVLVAKNFQTIAEDMDKVFASLNILAALEEILEEKGIVTREELVERLKKNLMEKTNEL